MPDDTVEPFNFLEKVHTAFAAAAKSMRVPAPFPSPSCLGMSEYLKQAIAYAEDNLVEGPKNTIFDTKDDSGEPIIPLFSLDNTWLFLMLEKWEEKLEIDELVAEKMIRARSEGRRNPKRNMQEFVKSRNADPKEMCLARVMDVIETLPMRGLVQLRMVDRMQGQIISGHLSIEEAGMLLDHQEVLVRSAENLEKIRSYQRRATLLFLGPQPGFLPSARLQQAYSESTGFVKVQAYKLFEKALPIVEKEQALKQQALLTSWSVVAGWLTGFEVITSISDHLPWQEDLHSSFPARLTLSAVGAVAFGLAARKLTGWGRRARNVRDLKKMAVVFGKWALLKGPDDQPFPLEGRKALRQAESNLKRFEASQKL